MQYFVLIPTHCAMVAYIHTTSIFPCNFTQFDSRFWLFSLNIIMSYKLPSWEREMFPKYQEGMRNFFEWSKSRQTTHNRFLCITVSLEKKLLTFWNIVVYHMYVKGFFQILSCTYVPFENPKIEFFSIQTRGISMWKLASKTASVHKYRRKWWIVQTFQFSMSIHISHSWKIQL